MKKKKIYYAHCIAIYGTPQEARDITTLERLLPDTVVYNPNCPECEEGYAQLKMAFFERLMKSGDFDALVFRALPDGSIPSGVAQEIDWFREAFPDRPVIELPSCLERRRLTYPQTKEYLLEVGER